MQPIEIEHRPAAGDPLPGRIDGTGWGLFFIWVGLCVLADLGWSVFFVGTGVLMLAGQLARRHFGLAVDRFAVVLGLCFAGAGLARLFDWRWPGSAVPDWAVPAVFMVIGAALVFQAWSRGRRD
jgi:hypothetical protein